MRGGEIVVEFDESVFKGVPNAGIGEAESVEVVGEIGGEFFFQEFRGLFASMSIEYGEEGDWPVGEEEHLGDVLVFHTGPAALG